MGKIVSKAREVRLAYQAQQKRPVTMQEVAEATGISQGALSNLELQKTERIDFDTLRKLCEFYGVPSGELIQYVPEEVAQKNRTPGLGQSQLAFN